MLFISLAVSVGPITVQADPFGHMSVVGLMLLDKGMQLCTTVTAASSVVYSNLSAAKAATSTYHQRCQGPCVAG